MSNSQSFQHPEELRQSLLLSEISTYRQWLDNKADHKRLMSLTYEKAKPEARKLLEGYPRVFNTITSARHTFSVDDWEELQSATQEFEWGIRALIIALKGGSHLDTSAYSFYDSLFTFERKIRTRISWRERAIQVLDRNKTVIGAIVFGLIGYFFKFLADWLKQLGTGP